MAEQLALCLPQPPAPENQIRLRCVQDGRKLRVRIVSAPFAFDPQLNCRFPRQGRAPGMEWIVPVVRVGRRGARRLILEVAP